MGPSLRPSSAISPASSTSPLMNPEWDIPIVGISSNNSPYYFSNEMGQQQMLRLGEATRPAIEKSGRRAELLASNTLSHLHFTTDADMHRDMSPEHLYERIGEP